MSFNLWEFIIFFPRKEKVKHGKFSSFFWEKKKINYGKCVTLYRIRNSNVSRKLLQTTNNICSIDPFFLSFFLLYFFLKLKKNEQVINETKNPLGFGHIQLYFFSEFSALIEIVSRWNSICICYYGKPQYGYLKVHYNLVCNNNKCIYIFIYFSLRFSRLYICLTVFYICLTVPLFLYILLFSSYIFY